MTPGSQTMNRVAIWVPDGHPAEGQSVTVYPDNGATTYIDGIIEFRSNRSNALEGLRQSLADLRAAVQEMKRRPSQAVQEEITP